MSSKKYFRNIDELPVWNFTKCIELSDYRYLIKDIDYYELPNIVVDLKIWETIFYQYLDAFGESEINTEYRKTVCEFWHYYWKHIETEDRKLITKIEIKRKQIERLQKNISSNSEKYDIEEQAASLELHFKNVEFDLKKMSVKRYFTYLKIYKKQNENEEIRQRKNQKL